MLIVGKERKEYQKHAHKMEMKKKKRRKMQNEKKFIANIQMLCDLNWDYI